MTSTPSIVAASRDPELFGAWFKDPQTWRPWFAILAGLFGLSMDVQDKELFKRLSNRTKPPAGQVQEAWIIAGRRSGKTFVSALIGTYLATFRTYSEYVQPGERVVVLILAVDRAQAKVCFNYCKAFFERIPMLRSLVERETAQELDLSNGVTLAVHANSYRSVRGRTLCACILDELGFWRSDLTTVPDREVYNALLPGLATVPGSMLLGISSPYRRSGLLFEKYRDFYGVDSDDTLVIHAPSKLLNPTISDSVINRAREIDPAVAASEWDAEFRSDLEGFLDFAWIEAAVDESRPPELPPRPEVQYCGFTDPSGGRGDAFTLAIAHHEDGRSILDVCRGRKPPFDPSAVVAEFAEVLKRYSIHTVTGDKYAAEWTVEAFREVGIQYEASKLTKSEIYLEAGPLFATGAVSIPDHRQLLNEFRMLERRTAPSGKDMVGHPPRGRDDYANSAAGALLAASHRSVEITSEMFKAGPRTAAADFGVTDFPPAPPPDLQDHF